VILVDTNLLVYSQVSSLPQHARARSWLDGKLNDVPGVGMAWPSLLAFVRLVSNPRIFEHPVSVQAAWDQVRTWLDLRPVFCPEPTQYHREVLEALIPETGKSDLVPDAHLAALAIEYGLVLQTTDRDFARFRGLRWENPLEEAS
jgi:toxin-antitoxin system PIN domain toxin